MSTDLLFTKYIKRFIFVELTPQISNLSFTTFDMIL